MCAGWIFEYRWNEKCVGELVGGRGKTVVGLGQGWRWIWVEHGGRYVASWWRWEQTCLVSILAPMPTLFHCLRDGVFGTWPRLDSTPLQFISTCHIFVLASQLLTTFF